MDTGEKEDLADLSVSAQLCGVGVQRYVQPGAEQEDRQVLRGQAQQRDLPHPT